VWQPKKTKKGVQRLPALHTARPSSSHTKKYTTKQSISIYYYLVAFISWYVRKHSLQLQPRLDYIFPCRYCILSMAARFLFFLAVSLDSHESRFTITNKPFPGTI
jgi:hypothetical protein